MALLIYLFILEWFACFGFGLGIFVCLGFFFAVCIFAVSFEVFSKGLWDSLFEPGLPSLFIKREIKVE